ncbi:MAG: family 10 glycosylhydrolase [Sodaliphilus sp.]
MQKLLISFLLAAIATTAFSATYTTPKREFRSAWIATVWALDWPRDASDNAANGSNATVQKQQMIRMLDSLKNNNFNNVCFQVRSMCDAMYESSYEPWSSYLTGVRGSAPSYDPLAFVVEECHKRGMECHAWVNPYRYSTGSNWTTSQDQQVTNGGHTIEYNSVEILDPGQQWTIDRITNVCREIVANYDVDGLVFDDYFYPNGIPESSSADDYSEWKNSGTSLSFGDWRRDNVNRMVKSVYDMIQATKPWVRFGISPAGVACTSTSVANKYGVSTCPSGTTDWQYDGIYSDPLAWISSNTIDYISPQVYWKIGATPDFSKVSPWWEQVAAKFNRHAYISSSISSLSSSSTSSTYAEYANHVQINRDNSVDGNFGSIFYSCKYLYAVNTNSLAHYLRTKVYTKPALVPAMGWKTGNNPGTVENVKYASGTLSWTGYSNVRYAVYAFPASMSTDEFSPDVTYLLDMSYATSFAIPAAYQGDDWQYAVCVVDRMGFEYEPAFSNATPLLGDADPVTLVSPANGAQLEGEAVEFAFAPVTADSYKLQVSTSSDFASVLFTATSFSSAAGNLVASCPVSQLGKGTFYWRVQTIRKDYKSVYSDVRSFEITKAPVGTFESGYTIKKDVDADSYATTNGVSLSNLWLRSTDSKYSNFPQDLNGFLNRGLAISGENIYISGRYENAVGASTYLDVYSTETGEKIQRIDLSDDASSAGFPANDVMTDASGTVIVSNITTNISSTPLMLYTINTATGKADELAYLVYSGSTGRIDHCAVYGDVTQGDYWVFAPLSSGNQVIRWTLKSWGVTATELVTLSNLVPSSASNLGVAPRVIPVDQNTVWVKGASTYPMRYNFSTGAVDMRLSDENLVPEGLEANGVAPFEFGDKSYLMYANADHNSSFNFTLAEGAASADINAFTPLWHFPKQGLGNTYLQNWATPCLAVKAADDASVMLYIYAAGNGLAAYQLSKSAIQPSLRGDVNGDGRVDVSDTTSLINMVLGIAETDVQVADINGDGKVDVSDVTALVSLIIG